MSVELAISGESPADQEWLRQAFHDYLTELTRYDPSYHHLVRQLEAAPEAFRRWYGQESISTLIIRSLGRNTGFVVVARAPFAYVSPGRDYRLGEFFIQESHRRQGLGLVAAREVFRRRPGRWEVTQISSNRPAVLFWRRVITECAAGAYEDILSDGRRRQSFTIAPERP
ncbi:MAG: GNAT family N-acetyltransferase [Thermodesulfobacteriota bacterium]